MDNYENTLTAETLIDGARMYSASADAVNDKLPNALHVLSHLLCTSIELALKAYLRHSGYSKNQLRDIGHNLAKLLEHAEQKGLERTGSRSFVLAVAGQIYSKRLLVYPEKGIMNVIMPWRLRQMADELIKYSFIAIEGEKAFEVHKCDPGMFIQSTYPNYIDASSWSEPASREGDA